MPEHTYQDRTEIPARPDGPLLCTGRMWGEGQGWSGCEMADEQGQVYHKVQKARPSYAERWYAVKRLVHLEMSDGWSMRGPLSAGDEEFICKEEPPSPAGELFHWIPGLALKAVPWAKELERKPRGRGWVSRVKVDAVVYRELSDHARTNRDPNVRAACQRAIERIKEGGGA